MPLVPLFAGVLNVTVGLGSLICSVLDLDSATLSDSFEFCLFSLIVTDETDGGAGSGMTMLG